MQSVFFQFFQYQHRTAPTRGIFSLVPALRRLFLLPTLPVPPPPGKMLPASPHCRCPAALYPGAPPSLCYPSHASGAGGCTVISLLSVLFKLAVLSFVPSSCPLFPNKLPYCLFQQIDSLFGFSCCPWAPLPPASLDFLCFLSGQLDFIGNHQQCHGNLPDLNRWRTVLAVFSFTTPGIESSAFPVVILAKRFLNISLSTKKASSISLLIHQRYKNWLFTILRFLYLLPHFKQIWYVNFPSYRAGNFTERPP